MWADLGAGKTHTLRYIERLCLENQQIRFLPVYAQMPKSVRTFFEVYRAIIIAVDIFKLAQELSASLGDKSARNQVARSLFPSVPDAVNALYILVVGSDPQKGLAFNWLQGARELTRRQIEPLGFTNRIHTSDEGVAILSGLVRLLRASNGYRRLVV